MIVWFSSFLKAQNYTADSLFGDNGIKSLANYGFFYNGDVSIFDDGDIFIQGRNQRIVFFLGIEEIIRSGFYHLDACGLIDSNYPLSGVWNNDFEPMYLEKSFMLNDKTMYVAGARIVSSISTPCMQKVDSVGNVLVEFQSPSNVYFTNLGATTYWKYLDFHHDSTHQKTTCVGTYLYGSESGVFLSVFNEDGTRDLNSFTEGTRIIPVHFGESYVFNRNFKRSVQVDDNRFLLTGSSWQGDSLFFAMVKLDGTLDTTFGNNGLLYDNSYNLSEGLTSIVTTERRFFQTERINEHFFTSTLEFDNDSFRCNLRKYDLTGQLDNTFGVNGKKSCFTFESSSLSTFLMEKVGENQLLLSYLKFNNQPTDSSFFMLLNEMGNTVNNFPISRNSLRYNNELMIVDQIEILENGTAFLLGSTTSGKLILMKFRNEALNPELTLNGNLLNSNITSTDVYFEWFFDGTIIEGENTSAILVNSPGEYIVKVMNQNCSSSLSDTLLVESVGQEMLTNRQFSFYPNPAESFISIHSYAPIADFFIYDISGQVIYRGKFDNHIQLVDISNFKHGMYFIRCGNLIEKLVVGF